MNKLLTAMVRWNGVNVWVHFYFTPGSPETGPSYASGGEPATEPEIDVALREIVDDDERTIGALCPELHREFDEHAYHDLVASAKEQLEPDPDDARDRYHDDCSTTAGFAP